MEVSQNSQKRTKGLLFPAVVRGLSCRIENIEGNGGGGINRKGKRDDEKRNAYHELGGGGEVQEQRDEESTLLFTTITVASTATHTDSTAAINRVHLPAEYESREQVYHRPPI